jgi:hypothetical protein
MSQSLAVEACRFGTGRVLPSTTVAGAAILKRSLVLLFGVVSYGIFFFTFLYQIGFVESMVVPKAMNDGMVVPVAQAVVINLVLLSLFAIQHTIMARLAFKRSCWYSGGGTHAAGPSRRSLPTV